MYIIIIIIKIRPYLILTPKDNLVDFAPPVLHRLLKKRRKKKEEDYPFYLECSLVETATAKTNTDERWAEDLGNKMKANGSGPR